MLFEAGLGDGRGGQYRSQETQIGEDVRGRGGGRMDSESENVAENWRGTRQAAVRAAE